MGVLPTPPYLVRFFLAFLRSSFILSVLLNNSTISLDRLRTRYISRQPTNILSSFQHSHTVDTLVFALFINVMEITQYLDS